MGGSLAMELPHPPPPPQSPPINPDISEDQITKKYDRPRQNQPYCAGPQSEI